jgi:tRNA U34 5-carboxymethylaminomethyl modifying GTPase MnmE/TrmE
MPKVSLLTPEGRGGIAVLHIRGDDAHARIRSIFRGRWPAPGAIAYGRFGEIDDGLVVDLGDKIEISVHGSPIVVEMLMNALGDREDPQLEGDRIQREAYALLTKAPTLLAARVLADQAMGALSKAIREGRSILETARFGIALAESPPIVALMGRPNVGKSTLFNALVQRDRALVSSEPGTTRDPIRELISLDGIPVRLVDTAGLGEAKDTLDRQAMARTVRETERADLVIHVRDAGEAAQGFSVINKCDLMSGEGLNVSALCGTGLEELRRAILRELRLQPVHTPGAPVVFTRRQRDVLARGAIDELF